MKLRPLSLSGLSLAVLGLLVATGCSLIPPVAPDATHYYVLTTTPPKPAMMTFAGPHWTLALRPVEIPSFLRGKAMQVRYAGNEIRYVDDARWAENLEAGISRVLRESLEGRGSVSHVVSSPGEDHDYEIAVRVLRCEGDSAAKVARFTAVVEIFPPGAGSERLARDTFTMEVPGWDGSYGQLALKLSEAVDGLADRIVTLLPTAEKK
ncbi:MAG: PqiC family protein [Opitutaceae bacterium]